ncbi:uncharacterized protein BKA55DRAFT_583111 [Fusarium redolens]|uniref:Uncharacterized protein n=1 Tax=Fusarium redolens TaxID=48865 RepID=A0A9P9JRK3_FUSRE|nr:uncharacterized protein BKA55DRAFT_583111 [Fusarium redolens]KAH7230606.1 hypothetical protein BKA55DRAFT_583111 [Fusarium redolens]
MRKSIDVLQTDGMRPRTAICRGAVYKGLIDGAEAAASGGHNAGPVSRNSRAPLEHKSPVTVTSAISRLSLGVDCKTPFDEDVYNEADKYWDEEEECDYVNGVMNWYIKKGQNV